MGAVCISAGLSWFRFRRQMKILTDEHLPVTPHYYFVKPVNATRIKLTIMVSYHIVYHISYMVDEDHRVSIIHGTTY